MRPVVAAATVAVLLIVVACGGEQGRVRRAGGPDAVSTTTAPAGGRDPATAPPGAGASEDAVRTATCQGAAPLDRDCLLLLPLEERAGERLPVVLLLHGLAVGPTSIRDVGRWVDALGRRRFLLVTPHGVADAWNAGGCCAVPRVLGIDDVAYLRALLASVTARPDADPARVYVVGHSNGGMMAYRLLCDAATPVVAMASVAGTDVSGCAAARPVPVLHVHATGDQVVPFAGGASVAMLLLGVDLPAADATLEARASAWGCGAPVEGAGDGVRTRRWSGCAAGAVVEQRTIEGGDHDWPRAPVLDTTSAVLDFFGIGS